MYWIPSASGNSGNVEGEWDSLKSDSCQMKRKAIIKTEIYSTNTSAVFWTLPSSFPAVIVEIAINIALSDIVVYEVTQ